MLKQLWGRVVTAVRPDRAELTPSVDFDPETGALSLVLAATVRGRPGVILGETLRSGRGSSQGRRFYISRRESGRLQRILSALEWVDDHRVRATGNQVPLCLDELRRQIPGRRESSRAQAIEARPLKLRAQLDTEKDDGSALRLEISGVLDREEFVRLTPADLGTGGVIRKGSVFHEYAAWPSEALRGVDQNGRIDHEGDPRRVQDFADRLPRIADMASVELSEDARLLIATSRSPIETQLSASVDFEQNTGTLRATLGENVGQRTRPVEGEQDLGTPRLFAGQFHRLASSGQELLHGLRSLGKIGAGGDIQLHGASVPVALELLKSHGAQLSPSAAAVKVHQGPLQQATYVELEDAESMIVRQNLVTEDGRKIVLPEQANAAPPEWLRIKDEYFKPPRTRAKPPSRGQRTTGGVTRLAGDDVPDFLAEDLSGIKETSRVFLDSEAAKVRVVTAQPTVETTVDLDDTTKQIVVRPKYRSGSAAIAHRDVKRTSRQRRYFRSGTTYHRIDWDLVGKVDEAARDAQLNEAADGSFTAPALHLDEIINRFSKLGILSESEVFGRFRERLLNFSKIQAAPLPSMLRPDAQIRTYQQAGYDWLAFIKDYGLPGILADEMGLGKTLQVLLVIGHFRDRYGPCPSLIVCPAALVEKWVDETGKFFRGLYVFSHAGGRRLSQLRDNIANADAVVCSYETLVRDADELAKWKWRFLIADEAQRIKNPGTQRARAVRKIPAEARIAITGTPVENSLMDLWSIFDFLASGYLGKGAEFERNFSKPISNGNRAAAQALQRMTKPFLMRRLKRHVASELPEKLFKHLRCELTPTQRQLYQAVLDRDLERAIQAVGGKRLSLGNPHIFAILAKLKQICCHPGLITGDFQPYRAGVSGKFDTVLETLEDIPTATDSRANKIVAFSQYREMARYLHSYFGSTNRKSTLIDGDVPPGDRHHLCQSFNKNSDQFAMVLTLAAGGVGLDLQAANYVLMYDRWWNPAVEDQAIDRVHRLGQDREVVVVTITSRGTLEERIEAKLDRKRKLADQVIEADGLMRKEITREELIDLVRLDP